MFEGQKKPSKIESISVFTELIKSEYLKVVIVLSLSSAFFKH